MKNNWDLKDNFKYKVQNTMYKIQCTKYNVMNGNNPLKSFKSLT